MSSTSRKSWRKSVIEISDSDSEIVESSIIELPECEVSSDEISNSDDSFVIRHRKKNSARCLTDSSSGSQDEDEDEVKKEEEDNVKTDNDDETRINSDFSYQRKNIPKSKSTDEFSFSASTSGGDKRNSSSKVSLSNYNYRLNSDFCCRSSDETIENVSDVKDRSGSLRHLPEIDNSSHNVENYLNESYLNADIQSAIHESCLSTVPASLHAELSKTEQSFDKNLFDNVKENKDTVLAEKSRLEYEINDGSRSIVSGETIANASYVKDHNVSLHQSVLEINNSSDNVENDHNGSYLNMHINEAIKESCLGTKQITREEKLLHDLSLQEKSCGKELEECPSPKFSNDRKECNISINSDNILCNNVEENKNALLAEKLRLEHEISEVILSLQNKKTTLKTVNLDALPDKGMKLKLSLDREERNLDLLNEQLNRVKDSLIKTDKVKEKPLKFGALPSANLQEMGKKALETHRVQQALTVHSLKYLYNSLNNCPSESQLDPDPEGLKVPLMMHQKQALTWLTWRESEKPSGGILADDMGLGKTLSMISLVLKKSIHSEESESSEDEDTHFMGRNNKVRGGTLIICPSSLIGQWESEIKHKVKRNLLTVEIYHGNNREKKPKRLARPDFIITSYAIARVEFQNSSTKNGDKAGPLFLVNWKRIILDEAHTIRNHKSKTAEAIFHLKGKYRWALTGTPVHNKLQDFFSIIKFLRCRPFDDISVWKKWVEAKDESGTKRLNTLTKSLMLRRTKDVLITSGSLKSLPDKSSETIMIHLSRDELALYEKVSNFSKSLLAQLLYQRAEKQNLLTNGIPVSMKKRQIPAEENPFSEHPALNRLYNRVTSMENIKTHEILVLLLRLRQICCHPSLIKSMIDKEAVIQDGIGDEDGSDIDLLEKMSSMAISDNENGSAEENAQLEASHFNVLNSNNPIFKPDWLSSKIQAVLKLLEETLFKTDDKIVIVSQWPSMLDLIYGFLKKFRNCECKQLTGRVPVDQRMSIVSEFNSSSSTLKVLLLSLTAGGTGLNLVGGNHLILADIHWNPQLEAQACDRIYRLGQKKPVNIYKLICAETIEERIQRLQMDKLALADGVLSGAKQLQVAKLSLNDLKMLFGVE